MCKSLINLLLFKNIIVIILYKKDIKLLKIIYISRLTKCLIFEFNLTILKYLANDIDYKNFSYLFKFIYNI